MTSSEVKRVLDDPDGDDGAESSRMCRPSPTASRPGYW